MTIFLLNCSGSQKMAAPAGSEGKEAKEFALNIMSYNIRHANPPSEKDSIDIDAIVKTIEAEKPDLVALQEVDVNTRRSGSGNQAKIIADKLGFYYFFGKALNFDGGEYGVAILSKNALSQEKIHRLPSEPGENAEDRVLVTAKIELSDDVAVLFGSTHLDYKKDSKSRLLQLEEIVKISEAGDLPVILAGDFNAEPDSRTINLLDRFFTRTCGSCEPTFPAHEPEKAIDFIAFRSPEDNIRIEKHQVISKPYASDHLPVLAVLHIW